MIEVKDELEKKIDISSLKDSFSDLKRKNLIVNKHKKEIEELKKQSNEYENYINDVEKNRIKKVSEINEFKKINDKREQEIKELNEKLEDRNNDDDMPYLETEEEAAERIADFHEKKGKG